MNQHVVAWLAAYHDGQLDPLRAQQVEAHLPGCPDCRRELQALDGLSALLSAWEAPFSFASPQAALDQLPARKGAPASSAQREGLGQSRKAGFFSAPLIWAAPPLVLAAGWLFWQMAIVFSRLLDALDLTAQLVLFWTPTLWRWPLFDQAPGPLTEILSAAGVAPFPGFAAVQAFFTQMFGLAALSVLLWGWLVFLWLFNRRKFSPSPLSEHESG